MLNPKEMYLVPFRGAGPLRPFFLLFAFFDNVLKSSQGATLGPFANFLFSVYRIQFGAVDQLDVGAALHRQADVIPIPQSRERNLALPRGGSELETD